MAFNFIQDFQSSVHRLLSSDQDIRLNVDRIYISVVQDARHPFLLINLVKAENISTIWQNIYRIEFEICIFVKDKNINIISSLADKITNKITEDSLTLKDYMIAGIRADNISFHRSNDLISTKLTICYKALLKGKIC